MHHVVRESICNLIEENVVDFCPFIVVDGFDAVPFNLDTMRANATWGYDVTLRAASIIYDRPLKIWSFDHVHGAQLLRTFHEDREGHPLVGSGHFGTIQFGFFPGQAESEGMMGLDLDLAGGNGFTTPADDELDKEVFAYDPLRAPHPQLRSEFTPASHGQGLRGRVWRAP